MRMGASRTPLAFDHWQRSARSSEPASEISMRNDRRLKPESLKCSRHSGFSRALVVPAGPGITPGSINTPKTGNNPIDATAEEEGAVTADVSGLGDPAFAGHATAAMTTAARSIRFKVTGVMVGW